MPPFYLHAFQYLANSSPHSYWFRWSDLISKGLGKDDSLFEAYSENAEYNVGNLQLETGDQKGYEV